MSLHYYLNVYKDMGRARAINSVALDQFKPFDKYLEKSIKALEKKEIEARWKKVETKNLAELRIVGGIYKHAKQTTIEIYGNEKGYYRIALSKGAPNFNKKLEYMVDGKEAETSVSEEQFRKRLVYLEGIEATEFDAVKWGFADVELSPAWCRLRKNDVLKCSNGMEHKIISVDNDVLVVSGNLSPNEKPTYNGTELSITVIEKSGNLPVKNVVFLDDDKTIFYSEKELGDIEGVERINNSAKEFDDLTNLFLDSGKTNKLRFEKAENSGDMSIILENSADYGKTAYSNHLKLKISEPQKNNADIWKIQLMENGADSDSDNELHALSPLRYFFSDNVKITADRNEYSIDMRNSAPDDFQIVLREKDAGKSGKYCFPPEDSILKVQVDTRSLQRQRTAINKLKLMPHKDHEKLIQLFEKREQVRWRQPVASNAIDEWFVLKDEKRSGCGEQRNFVAMALNTPDFAILEGPPGSGKTTSILELICQLVVMGKRVLLCGSTNVAIDNVLERLIEKRYDGRSLLERTSMLPVRIGHPDRVDESIEEYQIDRLSGDDAKDGKNIKQRLLLDAANLVCGTTMGIINHPKFRDQAQRPDEPITPDFDFLIIDESSKTTFQEFLVPALYAKRWILAGDVMQLSPFTDQEAVEYNFETISIDGKQLSVNAQRSVSYLEKMKTCLWAKERDGGKEYRNRFIMPCHSELIVSVIQELISGRIDKFTHDEVFVCITADELSIENVDRESEEHRMLTNRILLRTPDTVNFLELTAANVILVDRSIMDAVQETLPATHAMLLEPNWETMPHAFCHNIHRRRFGYSQRWGGNPINDSFDIVEEINKDLRERSWAKEIAWRINSENQLRLAKGNRRKANLESQIDEYTPYSVDKEKFVEERNTIVVMSFPSILESLVTGIKGKKTRNLSTISEGFKLDDLNKRKTTLTFQHRMHPDISRFPRSQYYKDSDALKDLEHPDILEARNWGYNRYNKRSTWMNVNGQTRKGGRNTHEVEALLSHLGKFLEYAVRHEQPEGKGWEIACLAFYRGQEAMIREGDEGGEKRGKRVGGLLSLPNIKGRISSFRYNEDKRQGPYSVFIRLCSVDRFQGHEADVVFLSMSQTKRDGFLDNPNRLNVAITRAKFQLVIFGKYEYFSEKSSSDDLRALALSHKDSVMEWR